MKSLLELCLPPPHTKAPHGPKSGHTSPKHGATWCSLVQMPPWDSIVCFNPPCAGPLISNTLDIDSPMFALENSIKVTVVLWMIFETRTILVYLSHGEKRKWNSNFMILRQGLGSHDKDNHAWKSWFFERDREGYTLNVVWFYLQSLYSIIRDIFMILRLLKEMWLSNLQQEKHLGNAIPHVSICKTLCSHYWR